MFNLPKNQFSSRLNINFVRKVIKNVWRGQISKMSDLNGRCFDEFEIEFTRKRIHVEVTNYTKTSKGLAVV